MQNHRKRLLFGMVCFLNLIGCEGNQREVLKSLYAGASCAPKHLNLIATDVGKARVFSLDPIVSSGNLNLEPFSSNLDTYTNEVRLAHLSGEGVLKGKFIQVLNGISCNDDYGAFEPENKFTYPHSHPGFQEGMVYFYGDTYQSNLAQIGYLNSSEPVNIIAHCELDDNAFYMRLPKSNGSSEQIVCLGDSVSVPGAYYSDDAIVTIHELEHATTVNNYSLVNDLNQFWYDEAGALNEAISDFMGLAFEDPVVSKNLALDSRLFSRWALGTFDPGLSHVRGAHKCPTYDPSYPNCDLYPKFSPSGNVSYVYPDGLGWPYPNNFTESHELLHVFTKYSGQEEIHNAGMLMVGTLWDIYSEIKNNHLGNAEISNRLVSQLILESIRHLPNADTKLNHSPVTMREFASNLIQYSSLIKEMTGSDKNSVQHVLKMRGFSDDQTLDDPDWMEVGSGTNFIHTSTSTPGVYVLDDPIKLTRWLKRMGSDSSLVTQFRDTGANSRPDPGELVALWFDIQNNSPITAGGVLVTVTSFDPDFQILDDSVNIGFMSNSGLNQTQIMYGKINGKSIVSTLNPNGNGSVGIPIGNSYFKTNPFFQATWKTAIWAKISATAPHGKEITLKVEALPSNGVKSTRNFNLMIN